MAVKKLAKPKTLTPKKTREVPGRSGYPEAVRAKALIAFRESSTVAAACTAAGISRETWYDWVASDPAFQKAVDEATEFVTDELEKEAIKRAKNGSDTLIIFLLKSRRRAQYGDKVQVDIASHPEFRALAQQYGEITEEEIRREAPQQMADTILKRIAQRLTEGRT